MKGNFSASINPVLLYRIWDNVLFESELEVGLEEDGETEVELEYAQVE